MKWRKLNENELALKTSQVNIQNFDLLLINQYLPHERHLEAS